MTTRVLIINLGERDLLVSQPQTPQASVAEGQILSAGAVLDINVHLPRPLVIEEKSPWEAL